MSVFRKEVRFSRFTVGGVSSLRVWLRIVQVIDVANLARLFRRDADVGTFPATQSSVRHPFLFELWLDYYYGLSTVSDLTFPQSQQNVSDLLKPKRRFSPEDLALGTGIERQHLYKVVTARGM